MRPEDLNELVWMMALGTPCRPDSSKPLAMVPPMLVALLRPTQPKESGERLDSIVPREAFPVRWAHQDWMILRELDVVHLERRSPP